MSADKDDQPNGAGTAGLGLAGGMARAFIHSPLSPLLLLVALSVGILGLVFTPRQEDPQISVPMVDIFVQYPGASSQQVASLVADPLERIMSEIPGVEHVYSASQRDSAMVTVQFEVGEAMGPSLVKLYDKLQSNRDKIPPGVSQPLVKPKSVDDVPLVTLTLWSKAVDDASLNLLALDVLQRIKEVPNTSQGFVVRGRSEKVRVEVQPERLAGYDLGLGRIAETIRAANSEQGVGDIVAQGRSFELYTGSFLKNTRDIEQLVIGKQGGTPIHVGDVADVTLGPGEAHQLVRYYTGAAHSQSTAQGKARRDGQGMRQGETADGAPAVTLAIAKKAGANGVTVAEEVLDKVDALKGRVIPDNIHVSVTRDYGETASEKVNGLILKLFIATGAVALLIFIAIGMNAISLGLRAAAVVLAVVPVVILMTVFGAWILGYTIDRVSLFALIFSIGVLVDDAIVVIENIYRRWLHKGETDTDTSVDAVREVGNPTILATFTVIAALLPMGFVSGMMGPYMQPIPALGSVAMLVSLFAAFIFTPWLAMRLRPKLASLQKAENREHRQSEKLDGFYRRLLLPLINSRVRGYGFLAAIVVMFFLCCALFYIQAVKVKMLPLDNKSVFTVVVNFPEGTGLTETANLQHRMARILRGYDEVTAVQTYAGTASPFSFNGLVRHYYLRQEPWQGDIKVQLTGKHHRGRSSHQIAVQARKDLTPLAKRAGARIQVVEMPPGPPVLQSVVAEVYAPDGRTRRQVTRDLTGIFQQAKNVADVDNYLQADHKVWEFEVDREKTARLGVSVKDINKTLDMAMGGHVLGDIKRQSMLEPTLIVLQLPLPVRSNLASLGQLPVATPGGGSVPLSVLGEFRQRQSDPVIYQKDLRPVQYVTGEGVGKLAAPIYGMLEIGDLLEDYTPPDGGSLEGHYLGPPANSLDSAFEWGGEWTVTYKTFRDMGAAFGVALVLIYMLVVWEFGNFTLPAIIMAPIPLTLIGIIPGHWLFDADFTATSMIGFIALAGIIVRNSILLVDFARHEIARDVNVVEALVSACKTRTRPIVITALALVVGSSVILYDPIFRGMAISLMFGVMVSTLLTLMVIPLGCISARKAFAADGVDPANLRLPGEADPDGGASGSQRGGVSEGGGDAGTVGSGFGYYAGLYASALFQDMRQGSRELLQAAGQVVSRRGARHDGDGSRPLPASSPAVLDGDAGQGPAPPSAGTSRSSAHGVHWPAVAPGRKPPLPQRDHLHPGRSDDQADAPHHDQAPKAVKPSPKAHQDGRTPTASDRQETSTPRRGRRGIRLKRDLDA